MVWSWHDHKSGETQLPARAASENIADVLNVKIVLDRKAVLLKDLTTKTVYNIL